MGLYLTVDVSILKFHTKVFQNNVEIAQDTKFQGLKRCQTSVKFTISAAIFHFTYFVSFLPYFSLQVQVWQ